MKRRPTHRSLRVEALEHRLNMAYVVDIAIDEDDGDHSAGDLSLREAISLANQNAGEDTIGFALGITDISTNGAVTITDAAKTTINGGGITIGAQSGLILSVSANATAELNELRFAGGGPYSNRKAIENRGNLTITNSTISNYSVDAYGSGRGVGGAIYNNGTLTIIGTTISGNEVTEGNGGGIYNDLLGTLTVINSTISGNRASGSYQFDSDVNYGHGGGIYNRGTLAVTNSTLTNNLVRADGRGIGTGGGIATSSDGSSSTVLKNTIVAGNFYLGGPWGDVPLSNDLGTNKNVAAGSTYNLIGHASSAGGLTNNVNGNKVGFGVNAIFSSWPTTPTLRYGSPAINAGLNANIPNGVTTDQRGPGYPRVISGTVDIGAFESVAFPPSPFLVDLDLDENDGDYSAGDLSFREAILLANDNPAADTISFAASISTISLTIDREFSLNAAAMTTVNGGGVIIERISSAPSYGVLSNSGTAQLNDLTIRNGTSDYGGGIYNGGTLTVTNSTISGNSASHGGGIYNSGMLTVTNSTISGNSAGENGGGIFNTGTLTVTNSTLSGNSSNGDFGFGGGGGIYNEVTLTVSNSTLSGNSAAYGGGGIFNFGTLSVSNSTLTQNRSDADGDNPVSDVGGGIWTYDNSEESIAFTTLKNTIVAGNFVGTGTTPNDLANNVEAASSYNLIGDAGSAGGLTNGTNGNQFDFTVNSVLDPILADNGGPTLTHALIFGSPAINAGLNANVLGGVTTDQRGSGFPRILASTVDIGAMEHPLVATTTAVTTLVNPSVFGQPVTITVNVSSLLGVPTGSVTLAVNGVAGTPVELDGGGQATFTLNALGVGSYPLVATYIPSGIYQASSATFAGNQVIDQASTVTSLAVQPLAGASLRLTVDVAILAPGSGMPSGTVTIVNDGASSLPLLLVAGTVTFETPPMSNGVHTFQAVFSGDLNTSPSASPVLTAVIGPIIVDNAVDEDDGNYTAGDLSLREAVRLANENAAEDTITFDANITTITLTDGSLTLTDAALTTINGNGMVVERSSSANQFAIFAIHSAEAALQGLTIRNGSGNGGGIFNGGTLTITNSILTGNSASGVSASGFGGGIYNDGTLTITNSTLSGNSANRAGGGIINDTGQVTLVHSTLTNNRSDADGDNATFDTGGGIWTNDSVGAVTTTLHNSIVAGNFIGAGTTPNDLAQNDVEPTSTNNLIGNAITAGGLTNGTNGNIVGTPVANVLNPALANNGGPTLTHALVANSPAINAGSNANANGLTTDQRGTGYVRFVGTVDIGAVEWYQDSDLNRDSLVDITDVLIEVFYFNAYANQLPVPVANLPAGPPFVDASGDGVFDIKDLLRVVFDFNVALGNPEGEFAAAVASPAPAATSLTPSPLSSDAVFAEDANWLWPELLSPKRRRS